MPSDGGWPKLAAALLGQLSLKLRYGTVMDVIDIPYCQGL